MTRTPVLDMHPETLEASIGEAHALLATAKSKLGFVPNMYGYMAKLPAVLANYVSSYDAFRSQSGFTPAEQETVFLTISRVNGCTYCMAAHSMIADKKSGVPAASLAALRSGTALPDAGLQAVAAFAEGMVVSRGNPGKAAVDAFIRAGCTEQHILGIVLAIAAKTFSNYVNHLAETSVDPVFAPYAVD